MDENVLLPLESRMDSASLLRLDTITTGRDSTLASKTNMFFEELRAQPFGGGGEFREI